MLLVKEGNNIMIYHPKQASERSRINGGVPSNNFNSRLNLEFKATVSKKIIVFLRLGEAFRSIAATKKSMVKAMQNLSKPK